MLHANDLVVYDGSTKIARHERLIAKGGERLVLDHTAIVDRLTFNGTIIETCTDSYRLAQTRAKAEAATT